MAKRSLLKKGDIVGAAIFDGSSWYHRYKELLPNGSIKYGRKVGFATAEEANESNKKYEQEYENKARRQGLKQAQNEKRISSIPQMKKYPRPEMQVQVLNKEQLKVLLRAASQDNWYLEILLATFAGLRKGEILGLKFQDFDLKNQTVSISRQLALSVEMEEGTHIKKGAEKVEKAPKSDSSNRTIYIPNIIVLSYASFKNE